MHPQQPSYQQPPQPQGYPPQTGPQFGQAQANPQMGAPQGQWQQGPPGPPQWGPPPQKKSGKAGLIAGIAVGGLMFLGAVGFLGYCTWEYTADEGSEASGESLPQPCNLVAEPTLRKLQTTNVNGASSSEMPNIGGATCSWDQTKGQDGSDKRYFEIHVSDLKKKSEQPYSGVANPQQEAQKEFEQTAKGAKPVQGIGDQAAVRHKASEESAFATAEVIVRKGSKVMTVQYDGWNKTFFLGTEAIPQAELEAAATTAAKEAVGKL